jgi:hypothetical protein
MRRQLFASKASSAGGLALGFVTAATLAAVLAVAPPARAADVAVTPEARTHFAAGVALLQDPKAPRYEEAYREFKSAYAISPSYKILGNLGLCAMKIERDAEAVNAFETYLKEAGPELTAEERAQIQRDLLTLKTGIVEVTVSSDPPGATIVDVRTPVEGVEVRNAYGEVLGPITLGLRHGRHAVTAKMPGYLDQQWEFEASGTTLAPHVFTMVKPAPVEQRATLRERPLPTAAYVAGAATLGLAATGLVVGLAALQKHNDFNSLNDGNHVGEAQSDRSSGQTLNLVTDGFFGAAIVGAVVTSYFVLSRPTVERPLTGAGPSVGGTKASLVPARVVPTLDARGGAGAAAAWVF